MLFKIYSACLQVKIFTQKNVTDIENKWFILRKNALNFNEFYEKIKKNLNK